MGDERLDPGLVEVYTDWKQPRRIRNPRALKRARIREPWCVICRERRTSTAHHIVFRSHGGDDVPGNLCGSCDECHALIHAENVVARRRLGTHVRVNRHDTIDYLIVKLGESGAVDYLLRRLLAP